MVYSDNSKGFSVGLWCRAKAKTGKVIAQYFPLNSVRKMGLKMCGYKVGKHVYIGPDFIVASLLGDKGCFLKLGDRVAIGPRVTIVLSSDANWSRLMEQIEPLRSSVILEDDCWIGAGAIILPGITIGRGAIVGAGSVVTKDVPAFEVFVGNPANFLKKVKPF